MIRNLSNIQKGVILLLLILLSFYLKRNWWKVKKTAVGGKDVESPEEAYESLTEAQKSILKSLAPKLSERLNSWFGWAYWTDDSILYSVDELNDIELAYLADYYNTSIGGDIKSEIDALLMPYDNVDDRIYNSLNALGY
jgi:hypothetical protein